MSTATTAASVNGSNVNGPVNPSTPSNSSGGRPQLKMNSTGKGADGARKQAGSPVDGGQRKSANQKAWTQGTNPITQRSSNYNNSNGVVSTPKAPYNPPTLSSETASPMRHLNDRMMFLLANLTGLPSSITLKNGEKYTGVLSGTSLDPTEMRYVFKMVKRVQTSDGQVNGSADSSDDYIGVGDNHVMAFDIGDVADFAVANVVLDKAQSKAPNGVTSAFRTDTDISGNMAVRERHLQKWEPSADAAMDLSLESNGQSAGWDQFQTNEDLFGLKSNYDESYYTTTIDRSHPQYAERAARAEKVAREIEGTTSTNAHIREERGIVADDKGGDEEEKYSGVRRDFPPLPSGQPDKYTPPARRLPTGLPTVPGAPVDPAIISSQLARPGATATATAKNVQRTATPPSQDQPTLEPAAVSKPEAPAAKLDPSKELPPKEELQAATPAKPSTEQAQKPSSALKPTAAGISARNQGRPEDATTNVEHQLLDQFKQFSATERMRYMERQKSMARESKAVKLNDLKKFSQNFKLNTPVPQDLVPILAKDESKQQLIVEKALRAAQESKTTPPKPAPASLDSKSSARPSATKPDSAHVSPTANTERQQNRSARLAQGNYQPSTMRPGPNQNVNQAPPRTGLLSSRLAINQVQHKQQGAAPFNSVPQPIPGSEVRIPQGPSSTSSGAQTPISAASKFNVRANEFRPNPAANTFLPGGTPSANSSPRPESASKPDPPRRPQVTSFFGGQRPSVEPLHMNESFNSIKRLISLPYDENKKRDCANNGGVPFPFKTPPTWDFPTSHKEKDYLKMFELPAAAPPITAPHNIMANGPLPHHQQLPAHLQGPPTGHQNPTPQHTPRHPPVQPHHGQGGHHHFEGHQMQFSQSNSSVHPSPRAVPPYMYGTQPQPMPGFANQVPVPGYGVSPNVQHVALHRAGGPQFMNAAVPGMGGHVMVNQPSAGPFMGVPGNPNLPMYAPGPAPGYPQFAGQMSGPPGSSGYPNPRPGGAPMMAHQGSQQGHQQAQHPMYMQHGQGPPMFAQVPPGSMPPMRGSYAHQPAHFGSPHQHNSFPQQSHRGTPSGSYSQPMMQQHSLQPQAPPPAGPANHGPDGNEEGK